MYKEYFTPGMGGGPQQQMNPQATAPNHYGTKHVPATSNGGQLSMKEIAKIHHQSIELMSKLYADGKLDDSSYLALCTRQQDIMKQVTEQNNHGNIDNVSVSSPDLPQKKQLRSEPVRSAAASQDVSEQKVESRRKTASPFMAQDDESSRTYNYFEVKFKRNRKEIFVGAAGIQLDDFVRVEADRGEDLGRVSRTNVNADEENSFGSDSSDLEDETLVKEPRKTYRNASKSNFKRILRKASREELTLLSKKTVEESSVLEVCRQKVRQRKLSMKVIDAEFQFDRHKLTFFFESDRRIDFRELVRDLFALYKTRIWLQQIEKKGKPAVHANAIKTAGSDRKKSSRSPPRARDE